MITQTCCAMKDFIVNATAINSRHVKMQNLLCKICYKVEAQLLKTHRLIYTLQLLQFVKTSIEIDKRSELHIRQQGRLKTSLLIRL